MTAAAGSERGRHLQDVVDGVRAYVLSQLRQAPLLAPGKAAVTIK